VNVENSTESTNEAESGSFSVLRVTFQMTAFVPEGNVACGGDTSRTDGSDNVWTRLNDAVDEGQPCVGVPYNYNFDGDIAAFFADYSVLASGQEPAFTFDETSQPELIEFPSGTPLTPPTLDGSPTQTFAASIPNSTQQFAASDPFYILDYCPGTSTFDGAGNLTSHQLPTGFDVADGPNDMSALAGFQYGCLIRREIYTVNPELCAISTSPPTDERVTKICVRVREVGWVRGDYRRLTGF
jgi:hypothetical protein